MKSRFVCGAVVVIAALTAVMELHSQKVTIISRGEWAGFVQEQPPLEYIKVDTPFSVRQVRGTIYGMDHKPLAGAYFEIGIAGESGSQVATFGTDSDDTGKFDLLPTRTLFGKLPRSGTYRFKVTKNGFHSTVGTLVVSSHASKGNVIEIELQPGP